MPSNLFISRQTGRAFAEIQSFVNGIAAVALADGEHSFLELTLFFAFFLMDMSAPDYNPIICQKSRG